MGWKKTPDLGWSCNWGYDHTCPYADGRDDTKQVVTHKLPLFPATGVGDYHLGEVGIKKTPNRWKPEMTYRFPSWLKRSLELFFHHAHFHKHPFAVKKSSKHYIASGDRSYFTNLNFSRARTPLPPKSLKWLSSILDCMLDFSQKHTDIYISAGAWSEWNHISERIFRLDYGSDVVGEAVLKTPASSVYCGFLKSDWSLRYCIVYAKKQIHKKL